MRRAFEARGLASLRFQRQRPQHMDEAVKRFLALAFRWLDQHGAVHHQREIHRHGMITLVDHRLGEIERGDAAAFQEAIVEQRLVHAGAFAEGCAHHVLERGQDIVGRKHRILARLAHAIAAMAQHVGESTGEHAHLAMEGAHAAEGLRALRRFRTSLDQAEALGVMHQQRQRREGRQTLRQHYRTGAGATAAMRRRESLVQVDVHGVDAQIARPHLAGDGVEVGTVAIEIAARGMDCVRHLLHARFK